MKKTNKKRVSLLKIMFITLEIILLLNITNQVRADFIGDATNWFISGSPNSNAANTPQVYNLSGGAFQQIVDTVNQIGTAVIAIVAVILGIKYMLSTSVGKGEVKDQMIGFLVACLLFFGWSNISSILISGAVFNPSTGTYDNINSLTQLFIFKDAGSVSQVAAKVFGIVVLIGKIVAVIATMYIGAKYILSGANGKADLKEKGPMYIIGILLIFSTLNVLSFISKAVLEATSIAP